METTETVEETQKRRKQRTIVLVVAAIALCCACIAVGIALYSWSSIQGGEPQEIPGGIFTPLASEASLNSQLTMTQVERNLRFTV